MYPTTSPCPEPIAVLLTLLSKHFSSWPNIKVLANRHDDSIKEKHHSSDALKCLCHRYAPFFAGIAAPQAPQNLSRGKTRALHFLLGQGVSSASPNGSCTKTFPQTLQYPMHKCPVLFPSQFLSGQVQTIVAIAATPHDKELF